MTTKQVGDFTVTAVSDGVLYSNHDVILLDRAESERLTGIAYGQPVPLDVNCFLIRHGEQVHAERRRVGPHHGADARKAAGKSARHRGRRRKRSTSSC